MGSNNKSQTVGRRYSFDIHFAVGLPIDELCEIEASDKNAWKGSITENGQIKINAANLFGGDKGEGGLSGTLDMLFGDEDQGILPRLAAFLGGIAPAFRGITTGFYSGLVTSNNPYPKKWRLRVRGGNRLWGDVGAWYPDKQFIWLEDGEIKAMNPAHILFLIYTGRRFRNLPRARMDDSAWRQAADQLYAEGLGLCMKWKKSDTFKSFRDSVLAHISAEVYTDRSTGLISIRLLRDDYDVDSLPLFDEDSGLLEVTREESASNDDSTVPSEVYASYIYAKTGETRKVRAVNTAVAASAGGRSSETVEYPGAPTGDIAGRLAARDLRIKTSALKRFKVVLDRRGRRLTPGAPFRIRSLVRGIDQVVVRVGRIDDAMLGDGTITITAIQDQFSLPVTSYVAVPPNDWLPPDREPRAITLRRLFEVPYRELAGTIDQANLQLLDPSAAYMAGVASAPTALSFSFELTNRVGTAGDFVERGQGDWCPCGLLVSEMPRQDAPTVVQLTQAVSLDEVQVGQAALIDGEIVRVDAVDYEEAQLTLARGCADTVPALHLAGSRVWFYDGFEAADQTTYTSGTTLQAKLLTNTSSGQLDPALAATDSLSLAGRQGRPYPPAAFRINGEAAPTEAEGIITLNWLHRDRITQADQLIDATVASIGPETGTTYTARAWALPTNTLLKEQAGINDVTATIRPSASYTGDVRLEVVSVRGGLESYQAQSHVVSYSPGGSDVVGARRAWRIRYTANYGSGYSRIGDIEFRVEAGGASVAVAGNGTADASNQYYPASRAFDGSIVANSNDWAGSGSTGWVSWDFGDGNAQTIIQAVVRNSNTTSDLETAQHIAAYVVEYSDTPSDPDSWFVAATVASHPREASQFTTANWV